MPKRRSVRTAGSLSKAVGAAIREARKTQGLRQGELAARFQERMDTAETGFAHQSVLSGIEAGQRALTLEEIGLFAEVLSQPLWGLLIPALAEVADDTQQRITLEVAKREARFIEGETARLTEVRNRHLDRINRQAAERLVGAALNLAGYLDDQELAFEIQNIEDRYEARARRAAPGFVPDPSIVPYC